MSVQTTFTVVPTTLRKITPRPPMTSKAAKKAYRESTKLPKISKAERRRLEAEEIARLKKELEKEKAATKAKAAREKKLKKEAEEKAKRKALGLPEPSRFVRPSQPTIKTFVKTDAGGKRQWEDIDVKEEYEIHDGMQCQNEYQSDQGAENPAKRTMLRRADDEDEDEFGDFPSLSQDDLPSLLDKSTKTCRTVSIQSSPHEIFAPSPEPRSSTCNATDNVPEIAQTKLDTGISECSIVTGELLVGTNKPSSHQSQSPTKSRSLSPSLHQNFPEVSTMVHSNPQQHVPRPNSPPSGKHSAKTLVDERSRLMPPPAIPMTVNRLRTRRELRERSINIPSPSQASKSGAIASISKARTSEREPRQANLSVPPPSTLAFLEDHLDDFFPSPSQQVRELLEEVNDVPSNTQIAREIGTTELADENRLPMAPALTPKSQSPLEDEALHFLSSQDLEISSQDLRDIDTPSRPVHGNILLKNESSPRQFETDMVLPPPRTPRLKPRFFEEKEDDLIHAALHESLSLARLITQSSSPRRSQRAVRASRIRNSDRTGASDEYDYLGSDIEADFLALLESV